MKASSGAIARQRSQTDSSNDYNAWRLNALKLDEMEGLEGWKCGHASPYYEFEMLQQRLANLQKWRREADWPQLIYSLREGLHRNLGNLTNPELYKHTHVGTKYLIDDYITEVCSLLDFLCDNEIAELPYTQKLQFFKQTGHSFGRSALLLSGGANMGLFHMGVVKALWEQRLLPRVVSGSSAGAVVAGIIGTHNEGEFSRLFRGEIIDLHAWDWLGPREMMVQKSLMNNHELERFLRQNLGEYTFEEAFKKTRRIINITVSPMARNQESRLLNYLTAPHLLVWSAVLASCAVPGLFPPVTLMTKDRYGVLKPYMSTTLWADGSLQSDLPMRRLGELYNVNHHIVSQTNPHVVPFITNQRTKEGWLGFLTRQVKAEAQYRSKQMLKLASYGIDPGILKQTLEGALSLVEQEYYGDVTIHSRVRAKDYYRLLKNISTEEYLDWVLEGERAAWPKIAMIRDQTTIGQTLEDCIIRLKKQRVRRAPEAHGVAGPSGALAA
jgi:NTE family protein